MEVEKEMRLFTCLGDNNTKDALDQETVKHISAGEIDERIHFFSKKKKETVSSNNKETKILCNRKKIKKLERLNYSR